MLDIGAMELFVVAVIALVVVGPKELPKLLRTIGGFTRKVREMAAEFRSGVEDLAAEVERETDPFADLKESEGLRPGMSPEEITEHILANKEREAVENLSSDEKKSPDDAKIQQKEPKSDNKAPKTESSESEAS